MKIKRLTIDTVRGIQSLNLDFSPTNLNVFLGNNGVGKSTVLRCLVLFLSCLGDSILHPYSDEVIGSEYDVSRDLKDDLINGIFNLSDIKNNQHGLAISLRVDVNEVLFWYEFCKRCTGRNGEKIHENTVNMAFFNLLIDSLNLDEQPPPVFAFYPVNRGFHNLNLESVSQDLAMDEKKALLHQIYEPKSLLSKSVSFFEFFSWFRLSEDLENEERRDDSNYRNRQLNAVRNAIRVIEPEFSSLRVRRSPLRMTITKDGQEIILDNLSDGEKCLMAMVGDIARRLAIANPDHPNPLEGEGIILIDEIELHLHPQWQRGILPKLSQTFPNCQFIVTTHSPQVVSDVPADSVFILEKDEEGNVTARHPSSSLGRDTNSILEDMMGVSERPLEFQRDLQQLFRHIDDGNIEEARQLRQSIVTKMESDDEPELAKADVLIRRKEILGR